MAAAAQDAPPSEQLRPGESRPTDPETATTPAAAANQAEKAEPVVVCKSIKSPGSRVLRRICGTEAQWAAANDRTAKDADEMLRQYRGRSGLPPPDPSPNSDPASFVGGVVGQ